MNGNQQSAGETKGKLDLISSTDEVIGTLNFLVNPQSFLVQKTFNYDIEPLLGKADSIVSYKSANPSELSVSLSFYNETANNNAQGMAHCDVALDFLREASVIDSQVASINRVKFKMGTYLFEGYLTGYSYRPNNFTAGGSINKIIIDITIVSTGTGINA